MRFVKSNSMKKLILVFILILSFCVCFSALISSNIALAVEPESYLDALYDAGYGPNVNTDWFINERYLDLASAKQYFDDLMPNMDLDYLEENPVVIAVIDTGIDEYHEMFTGLYDENGHSLTSVTPGYISPYDVLYRDDEGNIIGKNTASNKNGDDEDDLTDHAYESHGTHVSGILAMLIHYFNLEKYIKIMPIKAAFLKYNSATSKYENAFNTDNVLGTNGAYMFAVNNCADIINMSLTSDAAWNSSKFDTYKNSVITVAAAGNSGKDSSNTKYYPAASSSVIGVMNYSKNNDDTAPTMYSSSNYGDAYDICAPGTEIISSVYDYFTVTSTTPMYNENGVLYGRLNGTSMACPVVSFAAALLTLKYRGLQPEDNQIPANAIKEFLLQKKKTLTYKDVEYKVLDLNATIRTDFLDGSGEDSIVIPTSITVEAKAKDLTQSLDDLKPITFTAKLDPVNYEVAPFIYWVAYQDDGEEEVIGTGKTIQYTPKASVGYTKVEARMDYKNPGPSDPKYLYSPSAQIEVKYYMLNSTKAIIVSNDSINMATDQTMKAGETMNFSVAKYEYCNKETVTIEWYVNGELASTDPYFAFNPKDAGEYEIVVAVNTVKSANSTKVIVESNNEGKVKMEMWKIWLISTAITLVIAAIVVTLIFTRKK